MGSQVQAETSTQKRHLYLRRSDVLAATSTSPAANSSETTATAATTAAAAATLILAANALTATSVGSDRTVLAVRGLQGTTTLQVADPDRHGLAPGTSSRR